MKNAFLIALIISLVTGGLAYLSLDNYIIAIIVFVIYLLYYVIFARKRISTYIKKNDRIHYCYQFINSFVITMSVKDSLEDSFLNATQGAMGEYSDVIKELADLSTMDKVNYLRKYFNLAVYKMFINVLDIYQEEGGNLLTMSDALIQETTRIEDTLNKTNNLVKKIALEFGILWVISLGVLVFLRFGVSDFYQTMLKSIPFLVVLLLFFVLFLVSIHSLIRRATELYIKEDNLSE